MSLFERHIGRKMTAEDGLFEREWYVSRILTPEQLEKRWKEIGFVMPKPKPLQLDLFK